LFALATAFRCQLIYNQKPPAFDPLQSLDTMKAVLFFVIFSWSLVLADDVIHLNPVDACWMPISAVYYSLSIEDGLKLDCPSVQDCMGAQGSPVHGSDGHYFYHGGLCRSAVHSGVISAAGGGSFHVQCTDRSETVEGVEQNGITPVQSDSLQTINPVCEFSSI
jgi:hypothetical protein